MKPREALDLLKVAGFRHTVTQGTHVTYALGKHSIMIATNQEQLPAPIAHRVRSLIGDNPTALDLATAATKGDDLPRDKFKVGDRVVDAAGEPGEIMHLSVMDGFAIVRLNGRKFNSRLSLGDIRLDHGDEQEAPMSSEAEEREDERPTEKPAEENAAEEKPPIGTILDQLVYLELAAETEYVELQKFAARVIAYVKLDSLSLQLGIKVESLPFKIVYVERTPPPTVETVPPPSAELPPLPSPVEVKPRSTGPIPAPVNSLQAEIVVFMRDHAGTVTRSEVTKKFSNRYKAVYTILETMAEGDHVKIIHRTGPAGHKSTSYMLRK